MLHTFDNYQFFNEHVNLTPFVVVAVDDDAVVLPISLISQQTPIFSLHCSPHVGANC